MDYFKEQYFFVIYFEYRLGFKPIILFNCSNEI